MKIEERVKKIYDITEKFKVDGVIHHSLKFCDVYLYDVPKIKELLSDNEISIVFIESDGRLGSLDQLKTRIEAFSEMINN
jgi:benzoyl-CoA reductase/2-hydroxyglutaryl-CoA dehydratase subunit BcrC/BadD/HgdB